MGLFNYLICDYPLPGNPPEFAVQANLFHTKDIEPQLLDRYRITKNGFLVRKKRIIEEPEDTMEEVYETVETLVQPHDCPSLLRFYDCNVVASIGGINFTEDIGQAVWIEYTAYFDNGRVTMIEETNREIRPSLVMPPFEPKAG